MVENSKPKTSSKRNPKYPSEISRRQFLRDMGLTSGGMMVAGLSLVSACKKTGETTQSSINSSLTLPSTSSNPAATTTATSQTSIPSDTNVTPSTTSTQPQETHVPTEGEYDYVASDELPQVIDVPDTECFIATDRKYSTEHGWVKLLSSDIAVVGISEIMVTILGEPHTMSFPDVGYVLNRNDVFGSIEGYKLSADLIAPVSGRVLQINLILKSYSGSHTLEPLYDYPYTTGWMFVIKLSIPDELNDLMTPEEYLVRIKKNA